MISLPLVMFRDRKRAKAASRSSVGTDSRSCASLGTIVGCAFQLPDRLLGRQ